MLEINRFEGYVLVVSIQISRSDCGGPRRSLPCRWKLFYSEYLVPYHAGFSGHTKRFRVRISANSITPEIWGA